MVFFWLNPACFFHHLLAMDHNEVHKGDHLTHVGHSPADVNSTESLALEDVRPRSMKKILQIYARQICRKPFQ